MESSYDYWDDANDPESPEPIKAAADSLRGSADLAAAGGAAHAAVIAAGTAGTVTKVLRDLAHYGKIYTPLYIQAHAWPNLSRWRHYFGDSACYFANGLAPNSDDATAFRWAAHAIWNACTHSERARRAIHGHRRVHGHKVVSTVGRS